MTLYSSYGGMGYTHTLAVSNSGMCCGCIQTSSIGSGRQTGGPLYTYYIAGEGSDTLYNLLISGHSYPVVYHNQSDFHTGQYSNLKSDIYYVENVGVVKHIDRDTAFGMHVWELQSYHVINP